MHDFLLIYCILYMLYFICFFDYFYSLKVIKTSPMLKYYIPCLVWLIIVKLGLDFVFINPVYK